MENYTESLLEMLRNDPFRSKPYLLKYHWIRRKAWRNECDIAIFGGVVSLSGFRVLFEEDIAADDWEVIAMPITGDSREKP